MKQLLILASLLSSVLVMGQSLSVETISALPMRTSNNAVVEGFANGKAYVYSFGGIDETKSHSGIHLRSFRLDVDADVWEELDPLPDTRGKIASSASRVGDIIYIIGGYHVASNGSEESSLKVHRFDILTNQFMADGADIPVAIDDQAQVVRGHLIYVITGWNNNANVPNVQVYDTTTDTWAQANLLPNNLAYKVFGTAGTIIGDTIYYYGGAGGFNFAPSRVLRRGVIDQDNPLSIEWSTVTPSNSPTNYRSAASNFNGQPFWFGGAEGSYNFDGIAYNGFGGVEPSGKAMRYDAGSGLWDSWELGLPMDLRSVAEISGREKIIVGGMTSDQTVTDQVWRVLIDGTSSTKDVEISDFSLSPNPASDMIDVKASFEFSTIQITNHLGQLVKFINQIESNHIRLDISDLSAQKYFLSLSDKSGRTQTRAMIKK